MYRKFGGNMNIYKNWMDEREVCEMSYWKILQFKLMIHQRTNKLKFTKLLKEIQE